MSSKAELQALLERVKAEAVSMPLAFTAAFLSAMIELEPSHAE